MYLSRYLSLFLSAKIYLKLYEVQPHVYVRGIFPQLPIKLLHLGSYHVWQRQRGLTFDLRLTFSLQPEWGCRIVHSERISTGASLLGRVRILLTQGEGDEWIRVRRLGEISGWGWENGWSFRSEEMADWGRKVTLISLFFTLLVWGRVIPANALSPAVQSESRTALPLIPAAEESGFSSVKLREFWSGVKTLSSR